jgi:hypothetical protein
MVLGYLVPSSEYFVGRVWTCLMLVDFPVSLITLALAWKYSVLAAIWMVVVGTLWWYLLSRVAELVVRKFKGRREEPLQRLIAL